MAVSRLWIKLYVGILDDPKLAELPDNLYRVFINLLAFGGRVDRDGQLGTVKEVGYGLRLDAAVAEQYLIELKKIAITSCKKGVWSLKNWDLYQSKPPSASKEAVRDRVRKVRENKAKAYDVVTTGNEHVTTLHVESNEGRKEENREEKNIDAGQKPPAKISSPKKELATAFEQATGVNIQSIPERERGAMYWNPIDIMLRTANGSAADIMRAAVEQLRRGNMPISSPKSLLKTFASIYGQRKTQSNHIPSPTPEL